MCDRTDPVGLGLFLPQWATRFPSRGSFKACRNQYLSLLSFTADSLSSLLGLFLSTSTTQILNNTAFPEMWFRWESACMPETLGWLWHLLTWVQCSMSKCKSVRNPASSLWVWSQPGQHDLVSNSNSSYLLLLLLTMRLIISCHTSHTSQTSYVYVECNMHTCSYTVRPCKCMLSVNVHTCSHTVRPRKCMLSVTKDNLQWWHLWSVKAETDCFLSVSAVLWGVGDYI